MVPIPIYAVLGHLASGLVILAACEAAFDGKWLIDRQWTPGAIGLCGITAYVLGRLFAELSRLAIERWFVRRVLQAPEKMLLGRERVTTRWKRLLFSGYYQPLADEVRDEVLQQAETDGLQKSHHELFGRLRSVVEEDRGTRNRLDTLLQMSAICRTMCLGLLLVAAILVSGIFFHGFSSRWSQAEWRKLGYCALSLIESTGMLYRYLKFLRQHTAEVFAFFAETRM
jgi:hypothetical protein